MLILADTVDGYTMTIWDTIWPIIFVTVVTVLLYRFKDQIKDSRLRVWLPRILLILMIIFELSMLYNFVSMVYLPFSQTLTRLPLHLCSTSAVLVILYLSTRKEILLEILIIQGIVGALVTFVFPSNTSFPFEYDYMRFFFSHTLLYITPVYFIIIEGKRVTKKTLKIAFISVHIIAAIAVIFNLTVDSNYMYILPDNERNLFHFLPLLDPFPFLGNWPWVIVIGELLVFPVYFATYGVIRKLQTYLD